LIEDKKSSWDGVWWAVTTMTTNDVSVHARSRCHALDGVTLASRDRPEDLLVERLSIRSDSALSVAEGGRA
jgi:hypothetical protein